jgi:hypothetical protein
MNWKSSYKKKSKWPMNTWKNDKHGSDKGNANQTILKLPHPSQSGYH